MLDRLGRSYFFVVGFALFPPLAMLANNLEGAEISSVWRPLVISIVLSVAVFALLRALTRNAPKSALLTVVLVVFFFSYGHVYASLKETGFIDPAVVRHRFLLPLVLVGLVVLFWWLLRRSQSRSTFPALNLIALVLIMMPTYQITAFAVESAAAQRSAEVQQECELALPDSAVPPDIYLIVLDAYERDDVLREMHGYDNSPFLESLEKFGFYVARGSLSNYRHTEMTLSSMLNMDYLQQDTHSGPDESTYRKAELPSLTKNAVRHQLECLGYQTVAFETGAYWTEWREADYYITSELSILESFHATGRLSRFEALLIESTIVRAVFDLATQAGLSQSIIATTPHDEHRERVLFVFDQLERAPDIPRPKFVYFHVLSPHPPFVFGPNGEEVSFGRFETDPDLTEQVQLTAYADQVNFLNTRVLESVEQILTKSATPPVIVIQGDHGWADRNAEDKLSILNAYHLPDGGADLLYPTITPVNTFRTIFDHYFDAGFGFLQDFSYFSDDANPYEFQLVENSWESE